jgi:hypothetical protein
MRKLVAALALCCCVGWAANFKLYLKDGGYHLVREYQVQTDRVHFYSVERSDWEDIPIDLVDLKRTEAEARDSKTQLEADAKANAEEDKAERELENEKRRIPRDQGVYWLKDQQAQVMKVAESTLHTDKRREVLKKLSPVPMVTGKATLEIPGANSTNLFTDPEQEFYIQLSDLERFGIARLTTKGAIRIVENVTTMPVTNELVEEPQMVDILKKELDSGLYKIWPKEKLPPGEYAIVEYTEGKMNIQVWDFAIKGK